MILLPLITNLKIKRCILLKKKEVIKMEEKKEYLNENKYQKTSNNLFYVGVALIILGIILFLLIFIPKINSGTNTNKNKLEQELKQLKPSLENRYAQLKANGATESNDYKNKDGYEMKLIDIALNPTYEKCEHSSVYSDNNTTHEYCKIKSQLYDANHFFANGGIIFSLVTALMALMPCLAIGGILIITSKRRNIMAYTMQQTIPVAQEGIEKMAPVYGKIAKEIGKGIREGMKEEDKK